MPNTAKGTPYVVSTDLVANYPTVSSDLADHIDDNLAYNAVSINAQTGTTYTFALADASEGKLVTASNAAASTYTVPPQSSVTWADGAVLRILNQGAGVVTLVGGSGVTLNGGALTLSQYQYAELWRTASNTWTVTGIATPPGLTKITDSTFTSSAAVNVNDVFSSTYDNYRIMVDITAVSTTLNYLFRMRVSGSDDTGSNYSRVQVSGVTTTVSANTTTGTSFNFNGINGRSCVVYDVFGPNKAAATVAIANARINDGTNTYINVESLTHSLSTAYTGFSLSTSTGNMTGQVRVYGYRN
jgi:hypothetical protein